MFLLMVGCDPTNITKRTKTALVMSRRKGPRSRLQCGSDKLSLGSCVRCCNWMWHRSHHMQHIGRCQEYKWGRFWRPIRRAFLAHKRTITVGEPRIVKICERSFPPDVYAPTNARTWACLLPLSAPYSASLWTAKAEGEAMDRKDLLASITGTVDPWDGGGSVAQQSRMTGHAILTKPQPSL